MPTFRCVTCSGSVDLMTINGVATVVARVCPLCNGDVALDKRCAGKPLEAPQWWCFCDCCRSYWRFEIPEPELKAVVADSATTMVQGDRTLDESGQRGKFTPDWFERPSDCWPV